MASQEYVSHRPCWLDDVHGLIARDQPLRLEWQVWRQPFMKEAELARNVSIEGDGAYPSVVLVAIYWYTHDQAVH